MTAGDYFVYAMLALYGGAAICYAVEGNGCKMWYFIGAIIITLSVLRMEG